MAFGRMIFNACFVSSWSQMSIYTIDIHLTCRLSKTSYQILLKSSIKDLPQLLFATCVPLPSNLLFPCCITWHTVCCSLLLHLKYLLYRLILEIVSKKKTVVSIIFTCLLLIPLKEDYKTKYLLTEIFSKWELFA